MARWRWVAFLAGLTAVLVLLALIDSTLLRPLFPSPGPPLPRRGEFRPPVLPPSLIPFPGREERTTIIFRGFGPVGGLYTFWWFLAAAAGLVLVIMAALVGVPERVRRAAERVSFTALPLMLAAGVATLLLGLAVTVLLRASWVLLTFVPFVWGLAALGAIFGGAAIFLSLGRSLRVWLGPAPPLLTALAGLLVVIDAVLVPVLGWLILAVVAVTSLGLAVLTRMGSPQGWSLDELNW
jgi:hypothetical protein